MAFRTTRIIGQSLKQLEAGTRGFASGRTLDRSSKAGYLAGLVLVGGTAVLVAQHDSVQTAFSRRFVAYADAASKPDVVSLTKPGTFRQDPATDIPFPITLSLTAPAPSLTLVGLGVRTVSFLRVKVYSAGFYLESAQAGSLRDVPGWNNYTASHLLTIPPKPSAELAATPQLSGEAIMANLLDRPVACAVRIVPVRNTDFGHLRDGFTRAIAARQKLARAKGSLNDAEEERIAQSTQALKAMFPSQSVPKGNALTLLRGTNGALTVEYEGKILGQINDPWVSKELMLAYFADKDVISPKLKEDVAKGFEDFIQ